MKKQVHQSKGCISFEAESAPVKEMFEVLVFVEIKYRSNRRYGAATDAVDHRKQWRISKSAMYYYAYHGYEEQRPCRFDVITVQGSAVTHIQDAFDYCG